jgi:hypothetical protein
VQQGRLGPLAAEMVNSLGKARLKLNLRSPAQELGGARDVGATLARIAHRHREVD